METLALQFIAQTTKTDSESFFGLIHQVTVPTACPKLHFLEDHCIDWIENYRFCGLFSEQGGEQLQKSIRILELQSRGIPGEEARMLCVLRKHLCEVAPELISLMPKTKRRLIKRKKIAANKACTI